MFETSQDFFNLATGVGAGLALLALAALFTYTALVVRQVYRAIKSAENAFEAVSRLFQALGARIADTSKIGKFAVDVVNIMSDAKAVKEEFTAKRKTAKKK